MDINVFTEQLGLRNPTSSQVQLALAVFACEYVKINDSKLKPILFKENNKPNSKLKK